MTLKEAARNYVHPTDDRGNYADGHTYLAFEQQFGKENWQYALKDARIEYNFGSKAVKW